MYLRRGSSKRPRNKSRTEATPLAIGIRGDGAFGQFCIVFPEQDAVIAITADTKDMQAELNVVWDKLLPAFHAAALPANVEEESQLKGTLANLAVPESHMPNTLKLPGTK